ncbi:MAG TPA: sporulation initiation factor Spo0A C-terminal domain-containing protein [Clostridiales bacterium]|nr:sporulation initiation factor Spo0A C-terminal domain-containing protein [Clostridiales bacterium]
MRTIYRKVAKKHGVTAAEVKREMQAAVDCAYRKPDKTEAEKSIQRRVPAQSKIPTAEELICFLASEVKKGDAVP